MLAAFLRPAMLALPVLFAAMSIASAPQAAAQDNKVLKVGTLKLIHGISAYFYERFVPAGYTVEVYPVREPYRRQERGAHRHRRHLHPRHRRVSARRRRRRAGRDRRQRQQRRHGRHGRREHRHQDDQGSQGQEGRDLAGIDAGGRDPRAAADGGHVDQGHPTDPAAIFATTRRRSRAATSTPMSAPSRRRASASPTAPAGWSNIPIPRRSARST